MLSPIAYFMRLARGNRHACVKLSPRISYTLIAELLARLDKSSIRRAYRL
jgi:hypothetical protein